MGKLKEIVGEGGTVHRFVTTPFTKDRGLMAEVQTLWVQHATKTSGELARAFNLGKSDVKSLDMKRKVRIRPILEARFSEIETPEHSVLYILGHSDRTVAEIGGHTGPGDAPVDWWTPEQLVQWLTKGPQPLSKRTLCVKIWSCFSASNGFLAEFSRHMVRAGHRDTHCVGYTAITGGMYHPLSTATLSKPVLTDDEQAALGRARDHRVIQPLPRRLPPPPLPPRGHSPPRRPPPVFAGAATLPLRTAAPLVEEGDDDPYADLDVEAILREVDKQELPSTFLGPRLGSLKHRERK